MITSRSQCSTLASPSGDMGVALRKLADSVSAVTALAAGSATVGKIQPAVSDCHLLMDFVVLGFGFVQPLWLLHIWETSNRVRFLVRQPELTPELRVTWIERTTLRPVWLNFATFFPMIAAVLWQLLLLVHGVAAAH